MGEGSLAELTVEFAGEEREVDTRLTFGRNGDLELDSNQYMHRLVGEFVSEGGGWWIRNVGSRIHLTLVSDDGVRVDLPPGSVAALVAESGVVRFTAGPAPYELTFRLEGLDLPSAAQASCAGESTTQFAVVLTPREVDFLVTFARPRLLGLDEQMPTYAEVAQIWGVSTKTLDNTVQGLKRRLRDAGVVRDQPLEAMVGILVRHGFVNRADLEWADVERLRRPASTGPRFSST